MLEDSEGLVVKTVQLTIKTSWKWKIEAIDQLKKYLEVIGQTLTDLKGLGSCRVKCWTKGEGKEKRDMVIYEMQLNENSRRVEKAAKQL